MTDTAEVVIIGGGIVGSSVAYHLAEAGCTDVLIVEREEQQGMGSTGKSAGGVRAQFATPINIQMSLYSLKVFAQFAELTGGHTADYRAHGYLFIATTPRHLDSLRANRRIQNQYGVNNVEAISRETILEMVPQLYGEDILGGNFCPTDGFVDPNSVMSGFAARARELGVKTWLNTQVTGIEVESGRIKTVQTSRGTIATRQVVNAAGAWAQAIGRMVGVEIPVTPWRRQIVNTQPFDVLPNPLPMVIDMSNGFHFRRDGSGILMAWPDPDDQPQFTTRFDPDFIEEILIRAVKRVPCLVDAEVNPRRCWAGLYEVSPDHHAIIGVVPGVEGLVLVNGFSGHGVMHSPAAGRLAAEFVLGKERFLDASPLSLTRFAEGKLLQETAVL
ncbi:MAG: FAD-binding oxidoreductase [Acidobacteria bacterium]|nr:FAD-binding oxidoreductase [Acidobacteriota bacterium]